LPDPRDPRPADADCLIGVIRVPATPIADPRDPRPVIGVP
jgi:hypothetical protein